MVLGPTSVTVKTYVLCTGVLYTKFFLTTMIQGGKTFESGGRPPEDAKLSLAKGHPKQNYGLAGDVNDVRILHAKEVEHRWRRIIANDLESMPFALFVFGSGILVEADERVQVGAMVVYTLARVGHTVAYAKQKQPHRGLLWMLGCSCIFVGIGNAVYKALTIK
ncbi:hypothetical protein Poli38472_001080 [Pythium oligandrum]|uniref:Microsomal glutathione S-transferase 1 n=1 Tax=Pythium oligandrum TaxID=41045 RepID=A0A8K1FQ11_PYTOL|nr:hypothetical protein Poli38472_001080 [Pythium oligandrum]|eukprot:TMW68924.1 hypothetical protein Poli38472_001080 [Pythium oligandrum]